MSGNKCQRCGKTVYAPELMSVPGSNSVWHKGCFKCADATCGITLSIANYMLYGDNVYCKKHVPKPKGRSVSNVPHAKETPTGASLRPRPPS